MLASDFTCRPLVPADAAAAFAIFRESLNDYLVPAGQRPMPEGDDRAPFFLHLLRHDGPRCWGADAGGELVAWAAAVQRGSWWFLAMLFVLPRAQGRGVGGELLRRAIRAAEGADVFATVTDSLQPLSNTLYARRGMLPREALLGMAGAPKASEALLGPLEREGLPATGLEPEPLAASCLADQAAVDAGVMGLDRSVDHSFSLGEEGRRGWLFKRAGLPAGYVMYRPDGRIGPLACVSTADVAPVLRHALVQMAACGFGTVTVRVPAPCVEAQRVLWDAGLVFDDTPGLLLASRPFGRLDRYLPADYGLF
jgi:GNAT superfamily N-acetyltransferase